MMYCIHFNQTTPASLKTTGIEPALETTTLLKQGSGLADSGLFWKEKISRCISVLKLKLNNVSLALHPFWIDQLRY